VVLHGALVDIDEVTGKALHIERVAHRVESTHQS
jgi:calcineurin-like phosphoesterase